MDVARLDLQLMQRQENGCNTLLKHPTGVMSYKKVHIMHKYGLEAAKACVGCQATLIDIRNQRQKTLHGTRNKVSENSFKVILEETENEGKSKRDILG